MIKTIDDAIEFYAGREQQFSSFGASVLKRRPSALNELTQVAKDLGLPQDYVNSTNHLILEGVTLGFFELSPGDTSDICASLLMLNGQSRNPVLPSTLIHVAAFEADVIAVTKGSLGHGDSTVYFVDITTSPEVQVKPLAQSFDDFIVLASALDQAILEGSDDPERVIADLATKQPEGSVETWKIIASMMV